LGLFGYSLFTSYTLFFKAQPNLRIDTKLIRHILGMANAGGGYLIIGFPEGANGVPQPDPNIAGDVIASYDPTSFSQIVSKKIICNAPQNLDTKIRFLR
jgi:hypothetical protein